MRKIIAYFEYLHHYNNFVENLDIMEIQGKQERTVIHLELNGRHYYYGNLKALTDAWSKDDLGVAYNYLKNYGLSPENPYIGKKCTIRRGIIITSPRREK